ASARERLGQAAVAPGRISFRIRLAHLARELGRSRARPPVGSAPSPPAPAPAGPEGHVLEPGLRMAVLDPQSLDQLRSRLRRLRKLLAHALAERRRERVDLPHRRFSVPSHAAIATQKVTRGCDAFVTNLCQKTRPAETMRPGEPRCLERLSRWASR